VKAWTFTQQLVTLAPQMEPRHVASQSTSPPVDALGYTTVTPLTAQAALKIDQLGDAGTGTWNTMPTDPGLTAKSLHSAFVLSWYKSAAFFWCGDADAVGLVADCTALSLY
jgi:hypothetical protein